MKVPNWVLQVQTTLFRSRKEELIDRLVKGINISRIGTKYKPVTAKEVALRINYNGFFTGRPDHLEVLINECEKKGNYSKFFFVCPRPKVMYIKRDTA